MWELDHKEGWHRRIDAFRLWCWRMFLDSKEIQPVNPKGNQPWIFIGMTDTEAETPILWPLGAKNWLIGKDPNAGKEWRLEERGTTRNEMVGWHHWLDGHQFEWALSVGDGQESLACCSPWGCKESYMNEWLINNHNKAPWKNNLLPYLQGDK